MKKILFIILITLLLAGCSDSKKYSYITNKDDVIFVNDKENFTKGDLYKTLINTSESYIEDEILLQIAKNLEVDMDEIEEEAQNTIQSYIDSGYEQVIISYYGSIDSYKQQIKKTSILKKLKDIYTEENYENFAKDDNALKMKMSYFIYEDEATIALRNIESGNDYDTEISNNKYVEESFDSALYTNSSEDLPQEIKTYLAENDTTGVSKVIPVLVENTESEGTETDAAIEEYRYYILNIESRDVNEFKDEYIQYKTGVVEDEEVKKYMFENNDIVIHDQDIYDVLKEKYEVFK